MLDKKVKRVLVIDNEEYIREVAQICLETVAGWEVITASSGQEGLAIAGAEKPDVILLDVMMPGMDGLTTFQYLQNDPATKEIPVILLTGRVQESDLEYYAALGIMAAISKPFDAIELAEKVAAPLGWSLAEKQDANV
ncbi:response regulator [Pseudanabaena sp. PCC 6802]|uniref:response regulator n=1 Tax=Pseudanabaena sp. PCC 6802 TaxID=118173 RepID=UPI00034C0FF3|nr:response regulator [Pseudanabaena sp. PCC 6802]